MAETDSINLALGTGRRKTAVARIFLRQSVAGAGAGETDLQRVAAGQITVNGKPLEEAFPWPAWQSTVRQPLRVTDYMSRFTVVAKVQGGGVSAQAEAVRHGISRALAVYDETLKTTLRRYGLLTRDSRIKESKKYGLKRARRAPQYTKR